MTRHLLEIDDLSADDLAAVLDRCRPGATGRPLEGKGAALLFEKPSARTRHSTEMAVVQLGGHPIYVRPDEVGLDERETTEDVTRTLAGYHALIAARVFAHDQLQRMASVSPVPVVNLLSDESHPLQAIADLLTVEAELGTLAGRTVAWVGDFNNVARSLGLAAGLVGMGLRFACPAGYGPAEADLERLQLTGAAEVTAMIEAAKAVDGVDVVVTDTWVSMGDEDEAMQRQDAFSGYTVDDALMAHAAPDAIFLHCLPAHRGEEVTAEVIDGPRSRIWPEAANRLHAARGAIAWLLEQP